MQDRECEKKGRESKRLHLKKQCDLYPETSVICVKSLEYFFKINFIPDCIQEMTNFMDVNICNLLSTSGEFN